MNGCYIGRGPLLLSLVDGSRGFLSLSGNADITLKFEEDNESIFDARHGVNERIDWYVRNARVRVEAECFDINNDTLALLLKSVYSAQPGATDSIVLLNPITVGRAYFLSPNLVDGSITVTDAAATPVPAGNYTVDLSYGLITFNNVTGFVQPFTVEATWTGHDSIAFKAQQTIRCEALFKGFNRVTGRKVMAHFYRLALDISEELKMVQKGFSGMTVRLQATPDVTQPLDPQLGQYGRIMLL